MAARAIILALCLTAMPGLAPAPALAQQAAASASLGEVSYPGGFFHKTGKRKWRESNFSGSFEYVVTARSDTAIDLHDASRGVRVRIDLAGNQILAVDAPDRLRPLYPIIRTQQVDAEREKRKAAERGCGNIALLRSYRSDVPVTVEFQNRSGESRSVLWIDYDGKPQKRRNLKPGKKMTVKTFVAHPWMFTSPSGECTEIFLPRQGVKQFDITAPRQAG